LCNGFEVLAAKAVGAFAEFAILLFAFELLSLCVI
jgi:hypothetical protein